MTSLKQRRKFLLRSSGFALLGVASSGCTHQKLYRSKKPTNPLLRSIVETILPRDEYAGALELGFDQKLSERINTDEKIAALATMTVEGANTHALKHYGATFNTLDIDQREQTLSAILESQHQAQLRRAVQQIRILVFKWYYTSAIGQDSLNYLAPSRYTAYLVEVSS